ncbi:hypothetical protein [Avibacterium volantium]|uniref:hypothetical protein n=1 Tax=Avibacterium volantium TaxID=762 RepID=UPI003BF82281
MSIISEIEVIGGDCFYESAVVFCGIFGMSLLKKNLESFYARETAMVSRLILIKDAHE